MRTFLIILAALLSSCGNPVADSSIDQNLVTAPTPLPNIYIDERGNCIKQDGWLPPGIKLGKSTNTWIGNAKTAKGESIEIEFADMTGLRGIFVETPFESARLNDLYDPAKIIKLQTLSIPNNRPYCYLV